MKNNERSIDIFRKNLVRYMEREGLSQADIANRMHVQTSTVSYWVQGKRYPRPDAMQLLASVLQCTMADLMTEGGPPAVKEEKVRDANSRFFVLAMDLNEQAYEILIPVMQALSSNPEFKRSSHV